VFTPDGNTLAIGTRGGAVYFYDTVTWEAKQWSDGAQVAASALDVAPGGRRWAVGFADGSAVLVEAVTLTVLHLPTAHDRAISQISFSADGQRVTVSSKTFVTIHDTVDGRIRQQSPEGVVDPKLVSLDGTGQRAVTIDVHNVVRVRSGSNAWHSLTRIRGAAAELLRQACFSPDGRWLCHGGDYGTARVWDTDTWEEQLALPHRAYQISFSPDSRFLATLGGTTYATVWDVGLGREVRTLRGHSSIIESLAFSSDGRLIATGDRRGEVKVWSALGGREVLEDKTWVWGTQYSPDGRRLAMAPFRRGIMIWNADSGHKELTLKVPMEFVASTAFSPDGGFLVSAGSHHVARLWDLERGERVRTFYGHSGMILWTAYSPDDRTIATASFDGTTRIPSKISAP